MFTRREAMKYTGLLTAALAVPSLTRRAVAQAKPDSLLDYDATGLAELVRNKEVSPKELVEATIRRIEAHDGKINAVVTRTFERALKAAANVHLNAPFAGVPIVIKDNMDVAGVKTTHGSRFNKDDVAKETAEFIKAYEDLGFVIVGKSNMPEHGGPATTEPKLFGPTRNPWNLDYSPGGSSGGSAASVAMGYMPVAHANDGGGSNRIPASACNLFSLKPTRYRMIGELDAKPRTRFKSDLAITRTVRDLALLFHLAQDTSAKAANPPVEKVTAPLKRRLNIGLTLKGMGNREPESDVKARVEETARRLEAAGHRIVPADNPFDLEEFRTHFTTLFGARLTALIAQVERASGQPIDKSRLLEGWTIGFGREGATRTAEDMEKAEAAILKWERQYNDWIEAYDVMLTPVTPTPPPRLGYLDSDLDYATLRQRQFDYLIYTPLQNSVGTPAMSVPSGFSSNGLPIGSQFTARAGDEGMLFALAFELEQLQPWGDDWAPNSVKVKGL